MKDFSCTNKAGIRVENADQMLFFLLFIAYFKGIHIRIQRSFFLNSKTTFVQVLELNVLPVN